MNNGEQQQKPLAIILLLLAVFSAWFFLLKPAWQERDALDRDLAFQEKVLSEPDRWKENIKEEARKFSLDVIEDSSSRITVKGDVRNVLRLAQSGEEKGVSLFVDQKQDTFVISW